MDSGFRCWASNWHNCHVHQSCSREYCRVQASLRGSLHRRRKVPDGFIFFAGVNFILTMVAAVLCVCFTPTATGPGIPEIKAYLNGVDTPNMFGATTLIVKVLRFISIMTKLILVKVYNVK